MSTSKIICDAKNIVVLRIDEPDHDFTLSVPDLRLRVQKKLVKMEIPLPQEFELVWTPSSGAGSSVVLKNDEELRKAIQVSGYHKVTLQCHFATPTNNDHENPPKSIHCTSLHYEHT